MDDVPSKKKKILTLIKAELEDNVCYHYVATEVLIFLLSLAVRAVSRTGSVATGHMVCVAGRMKPRPLAFPKTRPRWGCRIGVPLQPGLEPRSRWLRILKE